MAEEIAKLVELLRKIAATLEANPSPTIGQRIEVTSGPGAGPTVGMKIEVTAGPGQAGPVIGNYVSVSSGGRNPQDEQVIGELRDAIAALKNQGRAVPRSWLAGVLSRVGGLGNRAIDAATIEGAKQLASLALS